jgi:RNA-directed DNA polymerase
MDARKSLPLPLCLDVEKFGLLNLIVQLNPLIRGWAYYHRHGSSKQTFATVDHALFLALWQWAKRRHPHKSRRWIKDAYFQIIEGCRWVFCGQ